MASAFLLLRKKNKARTGSSQLLDEPCWQVVKATWHRWTIRMTCILVECSSLTCSFAES